MAMLLISHTPEIQASLADRLMVMRAGRIVEEGDFERLFASPAHAYTRALLRRADANQVGEDMATERIAG